MTYCDRCHHSKNNHEIDKEGNDSFCHHYPVGSCSCRSFTDWDNWEPKTEDELIDAN